MVYAALPGRRVLRTDVAAESWIIHRFVPTFTDEVKTVSSYGDFLTAHFQDLVSRHVPNTGVRNQLFGIVSCTNVRMLPPQYMIPCEIILFRGVAYYFKPYTGAK